MSRKPSVPTGDYATVKLTHHALLQERGERLSRRPGPRSRRPDCLIVGHSWVEDAGREGGTICMVCQVVRWPS